MKTVTWKSVNERGQAMMLHDMDTPGRYEHIGCVFQAWDDTWSATDDRNPDRPVFICKGFPSKADAVGALHQHFVKAGVLRSVNS
jgi:hypothetical protein